VEYAYRDDEEQNQRGSGNMTAPYRIRQWVKKHFAPKYHDSVTQDLIDVASGTRDGNNFEKSAVSKIFPIPTVKHDVYYNFSN
jgi:hypothetical protein